MLIRSQNKIELINIQNVTDFYVCGGNIKAFFNTDSENFVSIADYSTEEKAIKVLDSIQEYYINTANNRCRVFQMPQESEVLD